MNTAVDNIFLTGFMGAGKSTVAAQLAKQLGWPCVDVDKLVEKNAGMSIVKLFETEGEATFRGKEFQVVAQVTTASHTVVALGGGSMVDRDNRERIFRAGVVVYLMANVDTILARTKGSPRPMMLGKGKSPKARVEELLGARKSIYEQANIHIDTEGKTPELIAGEILAKLETWKG